MSEESEQLQLALDFGPPKVKQAAKLVRSPQGLVAEFHEHFGCAIDDRSFETLLSRKRLLREEFKELLDEMQIALEDQAERRGIQNLDRLAKEASDVLYVVYGLGVALGLNLEEAFRRVHLSNMSKLDDDGNPVIDLRGKVMKGPNYQQPDMVGTYKEVL